MNQTPLLEVRGLKKYFPVTAGLLRRRIGWIKAVNDIDFEIAPGEVVGLVGESGSGKSTAGRVAIGLLAPTQGEVHFDGKNVHHLHGAAQIEMRKQVQMVFQDPYASLNPRLTIGDAIGEALQYHGLATGQASTKAAITAVLERIGMDTSAMYRYPHAFSGGQQQRLCIGRAIALKPKLIVCDEAVSALDVSVQAQILNLLTDLKHELHLSYLFIAHDLATVRHFCDKVIVLYLGQVMESAPAAQLFATPYHPYTKALMAAVPREHPLQEKKRWKLQGEIPSAQNPPSGCFFRTRCPLAQPQCAQEIPWQYPSRDHRYRCIFKPAELDQLSTVTL